MTERTRKSIWIVGGVLGLGVLLLATFGRSPYAVPTVENLARPLGLRSERAGDQLRLSWNPKLAPLNTSPEAELLIEDGTHRTQLLLSPDQIFRGNVTYSPYTDNVVFRMKAFDRNHKSTDEILQVIQSRATPELETAASQTAAIPLEQAGVADRRSIAPARAVSSQRPATIPGTMVVRGTLVRETPIDVRIPVDSHGRPLHTTSSEETRKSGGLLHSVAKVGKAPGRLWPFRHHGHPNGSH
ncbi:MAG: hypothetical protein M3Z32_05910 [Acidobacteriota bacterium]|nr:hypothetical protein [Acidobacteriota bacterium]